MINIVYSSNKYLFKGILLSTMSIMKHCKDALHIFILSSDATYKDPHYQLVTQDQVKILSDILHTANTESEVTLIDVTSLYDEHFKNSKNRNTSYSPYALNRLFIDLVPGIPDKILYLDTDTMSLKNIRELYDTNIEDYEFGAILDHMGHYWIARTYTNSGVLLLNVKKIRETGMFEKCRERVRTKWMKMPDQSAIYKSATAKLILPRKFNEQRDIHEDTVVKHFCNGIKFFPIFHVYSIKPWNIEGVHNKFKIHDFDDIYDKYLELIAKYPFILGEDN